MTTIITPPVWLNTAKIAADAQSVEKHFHVLERSYKGIPIRSETTYDYMPIDGQVSEKEAKALLGDAKAFTGTDIAEILNQKIEKLNELIEANQAAAKVLEAKQTAADIEIERLNLAIKAAKDDAASIKQRLLDEDALKLKIKDSDEYGRQISIYTTAAADKAVLVGNLASAKLQAQDDKYIYSRRELIDLLKGAYVGKSPLTQDDLPQEEKAKIGKKA